MPNTGGETSNAIISYNAGDVDVNLWWHSFWNRFRRQASTPTSRRLEATLNEAETLRAGDSVRNVLGTKERTVFRRPTPGMRTRTEAWDVFVAFDPYCGWWWVVPTRCIIVYIKIYDQVYQPLHEFKFVVCYNVY